MSETATAQKLSLARTLLARGGVLESSNGSEKIKREELAEALEDTILREVSMLSDRAPSVTAEVAASEALTHAENALNKTANDGSASNLTDLEVSALEAIIEVTGRPALRYPNGQVQTPASALGENSHWQALIVTARGAINLASGAVGRITTNNLGPIGTGWFTATDLLVTNRHVVEEMVTDRDAAYSEWKLDVGKKPFIDFAATDSSAGAQSFEISDLVFVADDEPIDLAILRMKLTSGTRPKPLTVDWRPEAVGRELKQENGAPPVFQGRKIYVVGHPYQRRGTELLTSVFGVADGMKRLSPGFVKRVDSNDPLMEHDCSTLGGNSGSCIFSTDLHEVMGLHIGGLDVDEATAKGSANRAIALSRLATHPAAEIIRTGKTKGV